MVFTIPETAWTHAVIIALGRYAFVVSSVQGTRDIRWIFAFAFPWAVSCGTVFKDFRDAPIPVWW